MAKRRKPNRKMAPARSEAKAIVPASWTWQWHLAAISALLAVIIWLYHPMILSGMLYPSGDTIAEIVNNHQILEYMQVTGKTVQWNPYPWSGMPNIFYLPRSVFSPDFYLHVLSDLLTFPLVFSMLGGIGMYLLLRYLRQDILLSFFGAALFLLLPFQKSMIMAGHFTKYEAAMYIPWIILGVKTMLDKPKLIHVLGLALALALQLRAGHYQVSFYSGVLVVALLLVPIWRVYKDVNWKTAIKSLSLFAIAAGCALLLAAQPLFIAGKFASESVRGGEVERLDMVKGTTGSSGVAKDLVSEWSFSPAEMLSVLVPHAVGGTSDHRLSPAQARRFRQNVIGTYWGPSPFNTSFYYLGALPLLLLIFGLLSKPSWLQKSLLGVLILMLIWALGTYAEPFYSLCYSVLPFFKNFRTPTTSFTLVNAILPILTIYGVQSLQDLAANKQYAKQKQRFRKMLWIVGSMILFTVLLGSILSFEKSGQNIADDALQLVREIRQGLYYGDVARMALVLLTALGILGLVMKRKMSISAATWIFVMLTVIDLGYQNTRYGANPISSRSFHEKYLASTSAIDFLKEDAALFRVEPFSSGNMGLPYHVQTAGGGLELQMNKYAYEVYYNNLHHKLDGNLTMNWNILDALNVKYIVSDKQIDHPNVRLEHTDPTGKYVYRYKFNVERGYFVDGYRVITDDRERLEALNDANLDLRRTALLESMPVQEIQPASRSKVDLVSNGLDHVTYTVEADADGLFVLSELYAPASQKVYLDGDPVTEVYKTNHLVQSITVPQGLHTIELRYESDWYALSAMISKVAFILLLTLGGIWAYRYWKQVSSA